jgi:hypothetical protein
MERREREEKICLRLSTCQLQSLPLVALRVICLLSFVVGVVVVFASPKTNNHPPLPSAKPLQTFQRQLLSPASEKEPPQQTHTPPTQPPSTPRLLPTRRQYHSTSHVCSLSSSSTNFARPRANPRVNPARESFPQHTPPHPPVLLCHQQPWRNPSQIRRLTTC